MSKPHKSITGNRRMAKQDEAAKSETANEPKAASGSKQWITVEETVKYNGRFYSGTTVEVDNATAEYLISEGHAKEADKEAIDKAKKNLANQRTPVTEKVEAMRAMGLEPAVDSATGKVIPNSFVTRETKLRDDEGNPIANSDDDEEDADDSGSGPDMSKAKSANVPDTSKANTAKNTARDI